MRIRNYSFSFFLNKILPVTGKVNKFNILTLFGITIIDKNITNKDAKSIFIFILFFYVAIHKYLPATKDK